MDRIICIIIGYTFGLFQTGYIYGRLNHIDIREHGSGNAGTTNAMRILGKKAGVITYVGDCLKAILAGVITRIVFKDAQAELLPILLLYTGLGVILGHNFPFYLKYKGGKGIAAASGVIASLADWRLLVIAILTFIFVTAVTRYVSLGSLFMMAGFSIELVLFHEFGIIDLIEKSRVELYIIAFAISGLTFFKHRDNIVRLINGNERKIGEAKSESNGNV